MLRNIFFFNGLLELNLGKLEYAYFVTEQANIIYNYNIPVCYFIDHVITSSPAQKMFSVNS